MQLPYAPVEFTTSGAVAKPDQVAAAVALARGEAAGQGEAPTHVLLLCHGWNNTIPEAEAFYTRLTDHIAEQQTDGSARFAVIGLLWPSVRWADDTGNIAGGGLAVDDPATELEQRIDEVVRDPEAAATLRAQIGQLEQSHEARKAFVETIRQQLLPPPDAVADDDPVPSGFLSGDVEALFDDAEQGYLGLLLAGDGIDGTADGAAADTGGAADLGDVPAVPDGAGAAAGFFGNGLSPVVIAKFLLNMGTYYSMKARAGAVGAGGVTDLLRQLADMATGIPVTLVGHSFGARVVSAAAGNGAPAHAMCLLQGAFSHYGFDDAQGPLGEAGAFRKAVEGGALDGPIVVTHSHKDLAVRLAYAIASRIAQQTASGLGDENDRYGGLGANGAVGMPSAEVQALDLGPVGTTYQFTAHKIYNLTGDAFISGHSAVDGPEVANAVRQAALAQPA